MPNLVRKYAFGGIFQALPHKPAATPPTTLQTKMKKIQNLNPKCVHLCQDGKKETSNVRWTNGTGKHQDPPAAYTHTHTHTHFQVQGLEKGVSENEAPGPVGAYTTTHNLSLIHI